LTNQNTPSEIPFTFIEQNELANHKEVRQPRKMSETKTAVQVVQVQAPRSTTVSPQPHPEPPNEEQTTQSSPLPPEDTMKITNAEGETKSTEQNKTTTSTKLTRNPTEMSNHNNIM
jgi:hypothetical protein